jgi:hypothetical protein
LPAEIRAELQDLKPLFKRRRKWTPALKEIGKDLKKCKRSIQRISDPRKETTASEEKASTYEGDADTDQTLAKANRRVGRRVNFAHKPESNGAYTARSLREAQSRFQVVGIGTNPKAVRHLRKLIKGRGCKTFCVNDLFDSGKQREEIIWGLMGS